jgi:hypothetical protein
MHAGNRIETPAAQLAWNGCALREQHTSLGTQNTIPTGSTKAAQMHVSSRNEVATGEFVHLIIAMGVRVGSQTVLQYMATESTLRILVMMHFISSSYV